jgi:hypothetical protein
MMADDDNLIRVSYELDIPQMDMFGRTAERLPSTVVEAAKTITDYGSTLIGASGTFREDRTIRDAVLFALLRRATITAEAILLLLSRGLVEPSIALGRTLLDIELAMKLIHNDETDNLALRLAAYHYYAYQRHGQDMLSHRPTRTGILERGGRVPEIIEVSKSYSSILQSDIFDGVRDAVRRDTYWHGYKSTEEALGAIGQADDYHMTYDSANWFVHAVNVDFDYDPSRSSAQDFQLKELAHDDPDMLTMFLGNAALRYCEILAVYIADRGYPDAAPFAAPSRVVFPDGEVEEFDSLDAIRTMLLGTFRSRDGEDDRGAV